MRSNPIVLVIAAIFVSISVSAQTEQTFNLLLKSGSFTPSKNISAEKISEFNDRNSGRYTKTFAIIQFDQLPDQNAIHALKLSGIELIDYIPNNAYTVTIEGGLDHAVLSRAKARAIIELTPQQKMHPSLSSGMYPSWAVKIQGTVDVWISYPKTFTFEEVKKGLQEKNFDIISAIHKDYRILSLRVSAQRVFELAALPFVEYVQPAPGEDQPLNGWTNWNRDGSKATILNAPLSMGGRNLKGTGVVIGVGDNADPQQHVDFTGRLITRAATLYRMHGTHVAGTVGGAGIRDELRMGLAPKSTIISQYFAGILNNAPAYVTDYGMVITNNSYGNINECSYHGLYDMYSRIMDQQAFMLPNLQHIFAAGNNGTNVCFLPPVPTGFKTIFGGYQSAKNVLSVGNAPPNGNLFATSSKGPVRDGRIKPEIITIGSYIMSAAPFPTYNYYTENTGTSMSAPAVAGGAALVYERFRQLTGNTPRNVVVKALLCNGADDRGNDGPDFSHGFGFLNLLRSVDMLENNRIDTSFIATGATNSFPINVPAGLSKLKVMLVWNDPEASVLSSRALVNDLDLEVITPASATVLPRLLDTAVANLNITAGTGADHINNIEQVTINNPVAGNYTVRVKGTAIPQNSPQQYVVVYDYVPVDIKVVGPVGGDTYIPGERILIQWDSHGDDNTTFTLEYSLNNGSSWTLLDANVPADIRYWTGGPDFGFLVPNVSTTQALIRVTKNATGASNTSLPFTILTQPVITIAPEAEQCEGYFKINWTSVTGATDYEVMKLQGNEMVSVAFTTGNSYTFSGLSKDSVYWVSVRSRMAGSPGRRALGVFRTPNTGGCTGASFNGDIKLDDIVSPVSSGRLFTSTSLGNSIPLTIRIKNLGTAPTTGNITVSYTLNGGAAVTETITNPNITGGGSLLYTFVSGNLDLSAAGTYQIAVNSTISGDPVAQNNSLTKTFKQLPNAPITGISYPLTHTENFDAAPIQSYNQMQTGLVGLDRFDFLNSTTAGRIRTFINSGMAYSGNRALTLDADVINNGNVDSLTATFNLTTFNAATDDIRLDFRYKNHGQYNHAANKVWIRGNDTQAWVQSYDLFANQNETDGSYKFSGSIEVSDLLTAAAPAQTLGSSFQVRWGQYGTLLAADNSGGAGYTFDDIRVYKVTDDIQMISIDAPASASCNLGVNTQVRISVRNSSNSPVLNVPVRYRVDGGTFIPDEIIPLIPANSTLQYTFTAPANLSATGAHLIETRVAFATDTYNENDTLSTTIVNSPLITVTNNNPYLQNFETGINSWYSAGKNSSWEYGTPASMKINKAASGSKAWKTRVVGSYNDRERSYLASPCFDISTLTAPTLSFSLALDIEDCGVPGLCDGAYVEYSVDGTNWLRLGANGQGTNWYNRAYTGNHVWSVQNYHRWHVATIPLPTGISQLRLRFVVTSDEAVTREGIAIDDIHIYDNSYGIYAGANPSPVVTQSTVNGSSWVHFLSPPASGQLIASVNPNGQNLGSTDVQAYIHPGPVRNNNNQYYHDRNITIKPANILLADSATVRFYFLDSETEALINATGCAGCIKPESAYDLSVSKYSDPNDAFENGVISDNLQGIWHYINATKAVKVPFDRGYYTEFKVKDFSEFWLNNGTFGTSQPLPLRLLSFNARKQNVNDVLVEWVTESEANVNRFEIEVAKGNDAYQQHTFIKIGESPGRGSSSQQHRYSFTDLEINKAGVRYYRLKIIDNNGSFSYSLIRPVVFNDEITWQVFPNPSSGIFNLAFQSTDGDLVTVKLHDVTGKTIKKYEVRANGFVQKIQLDLSAGIYPGGLYVVDVETAGKKQIFRIVKQ